MNEVHISTITEYSQKMPMPQVRIIIIFITATVLYGCEHDVGSGKGAIAFSESNFQIPKDGKLTKEQVADYIVIRQNIIRDVDAQKLTKKMMLAETAEDPSVGRRARYFDEIEKEVAQSYNMSYDEFLWIKDTVISTQTALLVQQYYDLNNRIMILLDKTLTRYKEINIEKNDQQEQLTMDGYVEEMKQEIVRLREKIPGMNERPEALEHNTIIISKFEKDLESLEQQAFPHLAPK